MKDKKTKSRLNSLIETDRLSLSKEASELICYDLKKLLENYFTNTKNLSIQVDSEDSRYKITINADASSIKSFGILK